MPYTKEYRETHREEINERNRERYHLKKDAWNQKRNALYKTKGRKYMVSRLATWRKSGIIVDDNTYEKFINTKNCELCNKTFGEIGGKTSHDRACLDHDHLTGHVRCVCCFTCNNYLKRYDNNRLKLMLDIHRYHRQNKI